MSTENLKEVFQQAAEIAKSVPKELREAAFNRAVDALLGPVPQQAATSQKPSARSRKPRTEDDPDDPVELLLAKLNRTKHPEITNAPRVLERALFLLRAARDSHSIDSLGASQIATVLTTKFRLKTTRQAVTQALDSAGDKVDRVTVAGRVSYRLMHPGEVHLDAGDFPPANARRRPRRKIKAKRAQKKSTQKKAPAKNAPASPKTKKKAPKGGRPGAGAMLKDLVDAGFFAQHRSIVDIQHHCETNLAHKYGLNELSTPLRRAVHSNLLERRKSEDGQYEYIAK